MSIPRSIKPAHALEANARLRDILLVLTRIPVPRGQLCLYKLLRDSRPDPVLQREFKKRLRLPETNQYSGLMAALSKRINGSDLRGPDGPKPGLTLVLKAGQNAAGLQTYVGRPEFDRAIGLLPDLESYLDGHSYKEVREGQVELTLAVPPAVQSLLGAPIADSTLGRPPSVHPESFEDRFARFCRSLPGQSIGDGRAKYAVATVSADQVGFEPTGSTGRVALPLSLVREWASAFHGGVIGPNDKARDMRHAVVDHKTEWAPYHHGFETHLRALVLAFAALEEAPASLSLEQVHSQFAADLTDAHLAFGPPARHAAFTRAFLSSLLTKRFVILTGLSGSGKSQIALRFGEWLGPDCSRIIPVRPDWTSPESLFGFPDLLRKDAKSDRTPWHTPEALDFILRAAASDRPHLLILDEMNLAHVERYFADILSGMESDKGCVPHLRQDAGEWVVAGDIKQPLPKNLFIIGTVNVDETTYMFSPKVLDRANTMEFRVNCEDLPEDISGVQAPSPLLPTVPAVIAKLLEVMTDRQWQEEHASDQAADIGPHLRRLHRLLSESGFEFGHRTYFEAYRFAAIHRALGGTGALEALDLQVMQKLLPRLHGSRRRLEATLCALGEYCYCLESSVLKAKDKGDAKGNTKSKGKGKQSKFDPADPVLDPRKASLPLSFDKLRRMTRKLRANQFVSFAE